MVVSMHGFYRISDRIGGQRVYEDLEPLIGFFIAKATNVPFHLFLFSKTSAVCDVSKSVEPGAANPVSLSTQDDIGIRCDRFVPCSRTTCVGEPNRSR